MSKARTKEVQDYWAEGWEDVRGLILGQFLDHLAAEYLEDGTVCCDIIRDDDSWHDTTLDHAWDLDDAVAILDQMRAYEETDSGLWSKQDPKTALCICARWTYNNACTSILQSIEEAINTDPILQDMWEDTQAVGFLQARMQEIVEEAT